MSSYKRRSVWLVAGLLALALTAPAGAAPLPYDSAQPPAPGREGPPPGLADRDGDKVSDGLQARLGRIPSDELVEVIVTFSGPGNSASARSHVGNFQVLQEFSLIRGFAALMSATQVRTLSHVQGVFRIEENFQATIKLASANRDFGATAARAAYSVDGTGVIICVTDTGVDATHEQLDEGKVADFRDFVNGSAANNYVAAPYDDHGHGTHVSAIAAGGGGETPATAEFMGVAHGATLHVAKVLDAEGSGTAVQIINGIQWCVDSGARVLSMSLGTPEASDGQDSLSQAVNSAADSGVVPVIAAGNSGDGEQTVGSPGAAAQAITVGAVGEWSAKEGSWWKTLGVYLAPFSSRGPTLASVMKPDVTAPGISINSACSFDSHYIVFEDDGTISFLDCVSPDHSDMVFFSGTSMATPYVAGAVALALDADGSLTPAQVKQKLEATAHDWGPAGKDNDWGSGMVDVAALLNNVMSSSLASSSFPTHQRIEASVANDGVWQHDFNVTVTSVPIAATIIIDGTLKCSARFFGICLGWEWSPDLDARLIGPDGSTTLSISECPLQYDCGAAGRQETLYAMPSVAGLYTIEVYPFSGSPNNGRGGSFAIDLSTGPLAGSSSENSPPVANDDSVTTSMETAVAVTLSATDANGDPLTFSVVSGPASGSLSGTEPDLTYTPNASFIGNDGFTFKANDGAADSNTATVSITVTPVNDAPVAEAQSVSTPEDTQVDITLTATDADEGDVLAYSVLSGPSHGVLSGAAPNLTYTPNPNYNGPDSFDFKANDGLVDSNTATVSITVTQVNDAPVAQDKSVTTNADTAVAVTLSATDVDGDPLTYWVVAWPTNGNLAGATPNLTYTPNPGYIGDDSFTYKANDGNADSINPATVSITVNAAKKGRGGGGGGGGGKGGGPKNK